MNEELDVGIVTPSGIWYDGKIYSCSLAVRQQWFKHAEFVGGWPVTVRYIEEKNGTDNIQVILQDGSAVVCIRTDHIPPVNASKLESYYVEFQRLAALRKRQQTRENRWEKPPQSDKPTNN
ncbi:hypothetical protein [Cohnella fermenti]|uniref:Uncharacterized protein n=1 Tax=Cohnella fermenti TaxID=2565925 RepID=A0A4S4BFC0_9BACL|nr:hypothetical protein [Cohnella fermenti]THF72732.1 hypothetical protein E6C55_32100 [Cohnella fermenti]